jgi:hypothetical protein
VKKIPWRFYIALFLTGGLTIGIVVSSASRAAHQSPVIGILASLSTAVLFVLLITLTYRRAMQKRDPTLPWPTRQHAAMLRSCCPYQATMHSIYVLLRWLISPDFMRRNLPGQNLKLRALPAVQAWVILRSAHPANELR